MLSLDSSSSCAPERQFCCHTFETHTTALTVLLALLHWMSWGTELHMINAELRIM